MRKIARPKIERLFLAFIWIILGVLYVLLLYQLLRKILGGSWEIEEIVLTAVTIFAGVLTTMYGQLNSTVQKLSGGFEQFEKRFARLESTFEAHVRKKKAH